MVPDVVRTLCVVELPGVEPESVLVPSSGFRQRVDTSRQPLEKLFSVVVSRHRAMVSGHHNKGGTMNERTLEAVLKNLEGLIATASQEFDAIDNGVDSIALARKGGEHTGLTNAWMSVHSMLNEHLKASV